MGKLDDRLALPRRSLYAPTDQERPKVDARAVAAVKAVLQDRLPVAASTEVAEAETVDMADEAQKPGRDAPKLNFRLNEEEWDRVDLARGKFSRQEFIRGAVLAALKTIEVAGGT